MENRLDVVPRDVFISWTGKDKNLKNSIVTHLKNNELTCIDSEDGCKGNYVDWSKQSAIAGTVFILVLTENTKESEYVPEEIKKILEVDDCENRILIVCPDEKFYENFRFKKDNYAPFKDKKISVIQRDSNKNWLDEISEKAKDLIVNQIDKIYMAKAKENPMPLRSMLSEDIKASETDFKNLYIDRTISKTDEKKSCTIASYDDLNKLIKQSGESKEIIFISGGPGSGKSQYINQIRKAFESDIVITLPCAKIAHSCKDNIINIITSEIKEKTEKTFVSVENVERIFSRSGSKDINYEHVVIVLDGVDEIASQNSVEKLFENCERLLDNHDNVSLVAIGRNERDANKFTKPVQHFKLDNLSEKDMKRLINKIFSILGKDCKDFNEKIKDMDNNIIHNPLLLTQLAMVYNYNGSIPGNVIELYDVVTELTFKNKEGLPDNLKDVFCKEIMPEYSKEKYERSTNGEMLESKKVFKGILLKENYSDWVAENKAESLVRYLQQRSIFVGDDFYHKTMLEYFAATRYFELIYDPYNNSGKEQRFKELFGHYADPYWFQLIKLFIIKVDSCKDEEMTTALFEKIMDYIGEADYTLLFDVCEELVNTKIKAQEVLVSKILNMSINGKCPPYGPLFWYVPKYKLYKVALMSLCKDEFKGSAKAAALVRDLCFIFAGYNNANQIIDEFDGPAVYTQCNGELSGIRDALCKLFYTGHTDQIGDSVYPRCFDVAETVSLMQNNFGLFNNINNPYIDELGLYQHESYNEFNGEYIGLISCPYDKETIEEKLKGCLKISGLILTPSDNTHMEYIDFYRKDVKTLYLPENIESFSKDWDTYTTIDAIKFNTGLSIYEKLRSGELPRKAITLPDGIKTIDGIVFKGGHIRRIVPLEQVSEQGDFGIPGSVEYIGDRVFSDCCSLESVHIPDRVERIGKETFAGCANLKSVKIPKMLDEIAPGLFACCTALSKITLPEGCMVIGSGAFENCTSLKSIGASNNVWLIEDHAFKGCSKLEEIKVPSIATVGAAAFMGCSSLKKISLGDGLTSIGNSAFCNCSSLEDIDIPIDNELTALGENIFEGCNKVKEEVVEMFKNFAKEDNFMKHINIMYKPCDPDEDGILNIPEGTEKIKNIEYWNRTDIKQIIIPDTVETIGDFAFNGCTELFKIDIPSSVKEIGANAFYRCLKLPDVNIPNGITKIRHSTFCMCTKLKEITIPDSVTEIESGAFCQCIILETLSLPETVTHIGDHTFDKCSKLSEMNLADGVEYIGPYAFADCKSLKKINIPEKIKCINEGVFYGCKKLSQINLPDSISSIGCNAFAKCTLLTEIDISKVGVVKGYAFAGCTNLKKVKIRKNANYNNIDDLKAIFEGVYEQIEFEEV